MAKSKLTTIVLSLAIALVIFTGSILVPILYRGAYYSQIQSQNLVERSGYSEEVIREAFDEMMDYCTQGGEASGRSFGTGQLKWSEEGKAHFDDVTALFNKDIMLFEVGAIILIIFFMAKVIVSRDEKVGEVSNFTGRLANVAPGSIGGRKTKYLHPERILGRGPLFWGPAFLLVSFGVITAVAAKNFDDFFVKFHHVFFPGKENWIFDATKDEIIKILPQDVFRNYAILIAALSIGLSLLFIVIDFIMGRRNKDA